ncbi:MAG: DNA-directed RNA polymerase subunit beta, partial [Actinobacteria bacterium]|nr:DNA-directed RNA polymerase subunit beta [Actinomycetota bacterium]
MASKSNNRERFSFGSLQENVEMPNLLDVQKVSFENFLKVGLAETFKDISPITDFHGKMSLKLKYDPEDIDLNPEPKFTVEECREKGHTYQRSINVWAEFVNSTGVVFEELVFMGDFPMQTEKGTFIVNGTERVVVSQLVRSPGVIFEAGERYRLRNLSKHQLVKGTVHPQRGEWLEFDVEHKPGKYVTAGTRVARKRRMGVFTLLRAIGYDEANFPGFLDRFVEHFKENDGVTPLLADQWDKERDISPTQDEALVEIYKRARPGEPPSLESARAYFKNAFFDSKRYDLSRVGRYKIDRKLGDELAKLDEFFGKGTRKHGAYFKVALDDPSKRPIESNPEDGNVLRPNEILAAVTYMLHLVSQTPGYRLDDQDHFANRRIRSVGELIQNQVRIGLSRMERVVRERMTTLDEESIKPSSLVNIRPVSAAIKEFFGTSQLSQLMDQVNPLSGIT